MKCPAKKFILQMLYGILESNKVHLSEIARSLEENTSLKKTTDRLSKNLSSFNGKENIMKNYIQLVKAPCCSAWFWEKSNTSAYEPGNTGNIPEEKAVHYCYKSLSYEVEDRRIFQI